MDNEKINFENNNENNNENNGESPYETVKKGRRVSLAAAVSACIICCVIAVLATFSLCLEYGVGSYDKNDELAGIPGGETVLPPEANDNDIPEYFDDLLVLDQLFNALSFDGIDEEKMKEAILDAYILATGDLYAEYLNEDELASMTSDGKGEFVGIGVSIVNTEKVINGVPYKVLEIISVFNNSPALENDVRVGDCIMYVDNKGEMTLVDALGYTVALDVMLGEAGTEANFVVLRPDENGEFSELEFSIPRRKVVTQSVSYRVSENNGEVGIVNITGFDLTTPAQFKDAVNTLRDTHGCKYFVFDVRNNPGGMLPSIEAVLSYFLDSGDEILSTEYSTGKKESSLVRPREYEDEYSGFDVKADEIGMYKELDCIVITNGNTASAAELFTATMRDYGIAEIVGETTYGKGCMQQTFTLERYGIKGALKLTVAMYYSASKTVYHDIGIVPDHTVELSDEAKKINFFLLPEDKDAQLLRAIEELTK